jgi:hypothetical protein
MMAGDVEVVDDVAVESFGVVDGPYLRWLLC